MSYWDTSALLKLYLPEADSTVFAGVAVQGGAIATSTFTKYEVETAIRRKESDRFIAAGDAELILEEFTNNLRDGTIVAVPLDDAVEREFSNVMKRCFAQQPAAFVRTSDALHIAAALAHGEVEFVTADLRQRAAAVLVGLSVVPLA